MTEAASSPSGSQRVDPELQFAMAVVREAGAILLKHFRRRDLDTRPKLYLDVVTEADLEAERHLVGAIRNRFPQEGVVGEEGTDIDGDGRVWYVDPLDGTYNYSRGLPYWCVSLGLVDAGVPVLGAIYDPLLNELFTAVRGDGARLNGQTIRPQPVEQAIEATVQVTVNVDRARIDRSIADVNVLAREVMRLRNLGALALELCYLACGRLDVVVQRGSHPWDYAAAALIAQEAGAVTSTPDGRPFVLSSPDMVAAATPSLHDAIVRLVGV